MHETEPSREQLLAELTLLHRRVEELDTTQATLAQQNASLQNRMQQLNADVERETTTRKLLEGKLQQAQKMEAIGILAQLSGTPRLMAGLLYGAGPRLMECVRLRVKDVDFAYQQITVRDGKGTQDRVTMLPQSLQESLQRHLVKVQLLHEEDLQEGYGDVYLPYAFERKDPNAGKSWLWQYVFPASKRSIDPRSGIERRHHISEAIVQRAVKHAIRQAGICKRGSCHTLRHNPAYLLMLSET